MNEIEKVCHLPIHRMVIAEICNNKIYRTYEDLNLFLKQIHRRTNELYVYENIIKIADFSI